MEIGIALIIGLGIGLILYAANSDSFSQAQRVSIYITIVFIPLQLLLFISYLIYNSQQKEEPKKLSEKEVYNDKLQSLKELKDSGILTDEEYSQKSKDIENSKLEAQIKELNDYKKLKSLFDDGFLTKEEFENKVEILRNKSLVHKKMLFGVWKNDYQILQFNEDTTVKTTWLKENFEFEGNYIVERDTINIYSDKRNEELHILQLSADTLVYKSDGKTFTFRKS